MTATETISPQSPMHDVLAAYPGARRALFRKYHIGGCSSCGFQPSETLAQLCERNGNLDVAEALAHIRASHEQDRQLEITPREVADQRGTGATMRGGHHCTQPLMKKLGVPSTARASFYFYNTRAEVARFIEVVREIQKFFGV